MPEMPGLTAEPSTPDVDPPIPKAPDSYPPVHNLPRRNENFVGRDDVILRIEKILREHGVAVVRSEASLPVSGKTATAIEYAYRYHIHYDVVWLFDGQAPGGLAVQQAQLDREMREQGIPEGRRRLLIFDGVDDDPESLRTWYPDAAVDLLLTARHPGGGDERSETLGRLDRRYSVLLLTMIAPMLGKPTAGMLAELLDDQPALLSEVGQFIVAGDVVPDVCLQLLTMRPPTGGSGSPPASGGAPVAPPDGLPRQPGVSAAGDRNPGAGGRITLQELVQLAELLENLDFMADLASRNTWLDLIEEQFGRPIRLAETAYIRTLLISLLRFAARQRTPAALDAIANATYVLAGVGEPNVEEIQATVATLGTRW